MEDTKYFSRSWAMLTRDRGWYKPILVLAAANLVPIAGPLGTKGYGLEWARLTAWGVDAAPKQKDVRVGKCIGSGWRGFVVDLGWVFLLCLAMLLIGVVAGIMPGALGDLLSMLAGLVGTFLSLVLSILLLVAEVRAAIYESIGAGFGFKNLFAMIKRDTKGFFRLVLMSLALSAAVTMVVFACMAIVGLMVAPAVLASSIGLNSSYNALMTIGASLVMALPLVIVFGYALSVVSSGLTLVLVNAVGLWMRQFDVAEWGRSEDPLPAQGDEAQERAPRHPSANDDAYGRYASYEQAAHDNNDDSHASSEASQDPTQGYEQPKVMPIVVRPEAPLAKEEPAVQPESQETLVLPQYDQDPHDQDVEQAYESAPAFGDASEPVTVAYEQDDVDPTVIFGLEPEQEVVQEVVPAPEAQPTLELQPVSEPEPDDVATQVIAPAPAPEELGAPESAPVAPQAEEEAGQDVVDGLYEDFLNVVKESDKTDD